MGFFSRTEKLQLSTFDAMYLLSFVGTTINVPPDILPTSYGWGTGMVMPTHAKVWFDRCVKLGLMTSVASPSRAGVKVMVPTDKGRLAAKIILEISERDGPPDGDVERRYEMSGSRAAELAERLKT